MYLVRIYTMLYLLAGRLCSLENCLAVYSVTAEQIFRFSELSGLICSEKNCPAFNYHLGTWAGTNSLAFRGWIVNFTTTE